MELPAALKRMLWKATLGPAWSLPAEQSSSLASPLASRLAPQSAPRLTSDDVIDDGPGGTSRTGDSMARDIAIWLEWWRGEVQVALSESLGKPVTISPMTPGKNEVPHIGVKVSGVGLLGGGSGNGGSGGGGVMAIGADTDAARVLINALGSRFGGMRGKGPLTAAEVGLFEFLMLDVIERVVSQLKGRLAQACAGVVIGAPLAGRELSSGLLLSPSVHTLGMTVRIGGREGRLLVAAPREVFLSQRAESGEQGDAAGSQESELARDGRGQGGEGAPWDSSMWQAKAESEPRELLHEEVLLALGLPPFTMAMSEIEQLAPGDCVLIGQREITGTLGCEIVTSTGWSLGPVVGVEDAPTHIVATIEQSPWPRVARGGGGAARLGDSQGAVGAAREDSSKAYASVRVLAGQLKVPIEHVMTLGAPRQLSFVKEPGAEGALVVGGEVFGWGELCRVDQELALRLTAKASRNRGITL